MPKTSKRTMIHRVDIMRVSDPRHGVVLPVEVAGLDGRLEPGEHLQVHAVPGALVLVGRVAHTKPALGDLLHDLEVPGAELVVQHVPLLRGEARVQRGQPPQDYDLLAERRARVLRGVTVAVHVAVFAAAAPAVTGTSV